MKAFFNSHPNETEFEQLLESMCCAKESTGLERYTVKTAGYSGKAHFPNPTAPALGDVAASGPTLYRLRSNLLTPQQRVAYTALPCCHCVVADQCHEDSPISPQTCEYYAQWLSF